MSVKRPSRSSRGGERDRVDEEVEAAAERLADLGEDAGDVVVGADVARGHERAGHGLGELADVLLDPVALEGERELRALVGQTAGDRPRDRAPVRDAQDESALALEPFRHGASLRTAPLLSAPCAAASLLAMPRRSSSRRRGGGLLQPVRRDFGEVQVPRVRAGTIATPHAATRAGRVTRPRPARPAAARRLRAGTAPAPRRAQKLDVARRRVPRHTSPGSPPRSDAAAAQLRRAIPEATRPAALHRAPERARRRAARASPAGTRPPSRSPRASIRACATRSRSNASPALIGATAFSAATGAHGDGDQDRRRRRRRRPDEPVLRPDGLRLSGRASRRAAARWTTPKVIVARSFPARAPGDPGGSPSTRRPPSTARTSPGSPPATPARPRRRAATIPRRRASPASRRAPGSATTASSTCRRRSATRATRRRSSPRSRPPWRTGWT